jgi:hypothetical protein
MDGHEGFFVGLFTACLFFATVFLWRSTEKLYEAGERQIKLSRSVSAVQARNTRRQLRLTERTAESQLRAYVGANSLYFDPLSAERPVRVVIEIKNFGQTPARDFRAILLAVAREHPPIGPMAGAESRPESRGDGESLMPGGTSIVICECWVGFDLAAKTNTIQAVRNGTMAIYVCGTIFYRDVFGHPRHTNLRRIARGTRIDTRSPFITPDEGNESD